MLTINNMNYKSKLSYSKKIFKESKSNQLNETHIHIDNNNATNNEFSYIENEYTIQVTRNLKNEEINRKFSENLVDRFWKEEKNKKLRSTNKSKYNNILIKRNKSPDQKFYSKKNNPKFRSISAALYTNNRKLLENNSSFSPKFLRESRKYFVYSAPLLKTNEDTNNFFGSTEILHKVNEKLIKIKLNEDNLLEKKDHLNILDQTQPDFIRTWNDKTILRHQKRIFRKSMNVDKWVDAHKRHSSNIPLNFFIKSYNSSFLNLSLTNLTIENQNNKINGKTRSIRQLTDLTLIDKVKNRLQTDLENKIRDLIKKETQNEFNSIVERIKIFLSDVEQTNYSDYFSNKASNLKNSKFEKINLYDLENK